jgi:RNA polymerase sigma-70 factor (ECF subfamily)
MTGRAIAMAVASDRPHEDATERLGTLFDTHHQRLYRLARRLASNADEGRDLVQETFLHAARAPESIPSGPDHEEAWLVRVLINVCRDRWRRTAVRTRLQPFHMADEAAPDPERTAIARTMVWRALAVLPPRRRAILVMYEIEGAAISVIAKMLGVRPVTVRWHLSRGRRELAKILGGTWETR